MALFLHIGLSKTGTTFLQNWFIFPTVRIELRKQFQLTQRMHESTLIWNLINDEVFSLGLNYHDPLEKIFNYTKISVPVLSQISHIMSNDMEGREQSFLYSAEGFSDLAVFNKDFVDSQSFEQIIKKFKEHGNLHKGLKIILTIRKQDQFIESMYMQNVRTGSILNFDEYLDWFPMENLNWLVLIEKLETLIGTGNVIVLPYETVIQISNGYVHFVQSFLQSIDNRIKVDILAKNGKISHVSGFNTVTKMPIANPSLSPDQLNLAIEANKTLSSNQAMEEYKRLIVEFPKAIGQSFDLLSEKDRATIISKFSAENKEVFRRYLADYDGTYYTSQNS